MARAHDCGPEPSLRTALSSSSLRPTAAAFRFPRAHQGCAPPTRPRRRAAPSWLDAPLERGSLTILAWPASSGRAGGRLRHTRRLGVVAVVACALLMIGLLMVPAIRWGRWSDGWRAASSRLLDQTRTRATRLRWRPGFVPASVEICSIARVPRLVCAQRHRKTQDAANASKGRPGGRPEARPASPFFTGA